MSTPSSFTTWCIETTLPCLITKPLSQPIWLVGTQVAAEHHHNKKLDQRENISTILNLIICHRISLNFNTAENVVNIATKKDLTKKSFREMHWVWCIFVPCKRMKLFSKTSFLADSERYLFIVVYFSYSVVEILIKQNKHTKLYNYAFHWSVQ